MTTPSQNDNDSKLISYFLLRKCIGWIAIILPLGVYLLNILFANCETWASLDSISAYYHSDARNLFVGALCAVSIFMFTYRGYDDDYKYFRAGSIFILLVAFFQTKFVAQNACNFDNTRDWLYNTVIGDYQWLDVFWMVHNVSAICFFAILSFIVYYRFTLSGPSPSVEKLTRNKTFKFLGLVMIISLILTIVMAVMGQSIFIPEWIIIYSFGLAWLIKGQIVMKDNDQNSLPLWHV